MDREPKVALGKSLLHRLSLSSIGEAEVGFIIRDLDYAGLAIVPKEATDAGLMAGLQAGLDRMKECGVDGLSPFIDYPSPTETTKLCYRAMVAAEAVKP